MDNVWIVIPAFNEEKYIHSVIDNVKLICEKIVVVIDGSTDSTYEICNNLGVKVLIHRTNLGKGAALRTGCEYAVNNGAKKIIMMDSDGQHNPNKIVSLVNKLNYFDVVFTYREKSNEMPLRFKFGNWFLSIVCKILFKVKLKDTQCGYRAFNSNVYSNLKWGSSGYVVESEIIKNVGKNNLSYCEIPIETVYLDKGKGTTIFDGVKIFFNIIKLRLDLINR